MTLLLVRVSESSTPFLVTVSESSMAPVVFTPSPDASSTLLADAATVRRALGETHYPSLKRVEVNLQEGRIVLQGVLGSYHLKQMAQTVAMKTAGRLRILNCLIVA
jgi:hypothetical protein